MHKECKKGVSNQSELMRRKIKSLCGLAHENNQNYARYILTYNVTDLDIYEKDT
jgi:hypothetical protein